MEVVVVNELVRLYKSIFGMPKRAVISIRNDKPIFVAWALVLIFGIAYIVSTQKLSVTYSVIFFVIYILGCTFASYRVNDSVKKKYTSISNRENLLMKEYVKKVSEELEFDLTMPRVRMAIEEYLQFHLEKERQKESFLSLFKPILSLVVFLFPLVLPFLIQQGGSVIVELTVMIAIYLVAISIVGKALFIEFNGLSREGILTRILEYLYEEKLKDLKVDVKVGQVTVLLETRDFKKVVSLLENWPTEEWKDCDLTSLEPALHSICGPVNWELLRRTIKEI